jgi:hypothetical protein
MKWDAQQERQAGPLATRARKDGRVGRPTTPCPAFASSLFRIQLLRCIRMPASPHATSAHSASLVSKESRAALLAWFHAARAKRMMPWRRLPPDGQSRGEYRKRLAEDGRLGQWAYEVRL